MVVLTGGATVGFRDVVIWGEFKLFSTTMTMAVGLLVAG